MIITTEKVMRPRDPNDHYPTDAAVCIAGLRLIPDEPRLVLDPGCGSGAWGEAANRYVWTGGLGGCIVHGVELRDVTPNPYYAEVIHENFLLWTPSMEYDAVIGNPPYKDAEAFIRAGMKALRRGGYMVQLLRLAFLEGQRRRTGFWREFPLLQVAVCSKRPSFTGDGKTDATAYAVFVWQKGARPDYAKQTFLDW